jgi:type II secretory pathway component PulJ
MKESRIILIQDLLDQKKRKQKELAFYLEKMEELTRKMQYLQRDIALTEHIIKLIEKDKITEIQK